MRGKAQRVARPAQTRQQNSGYLGAGQYVSTVIIP